MADPMRRGNLRARFNYADDVGILGIGRNTAESAAMAQSEVDSLISWAGSNALSFDTEKSEVINFQGRNNEEQLVIRVNDIFIEPEAHIRWFGVHLDSQLSFKNHVSTWYGKALKIAQHLRRFNSMKRGAAPRALVSVVDACVFSVARYGADIWWPGMTRQTARGVVTLQTKNFRNLIDEAARLFLSATLPVWKTTPNVVLHREGGIATFSVLLEGYGRRLAARLKSLDDRHPLRIRASKCPKIEIIKILP